MDSTTPLFRVGDYIILTHPYRGIPAGARGKLLPWHRCPPRCIGCILAMPCQLPRSRRIV
jgi:hypothetical protein